MQYYNSIIPSKRNKQKMRRIINHMRWIKI